MSCDEKKLRYYELMEQLVSAMTNTTLDKEKTVSSIQYALGELSKMFRISRSEVCVYRNEAEEKNGSGEMICSYDTGTEHELVKSVRVVTSVMTVTCVNVYMTPGTKPLDDVEKSRVELVMNTTLSYVSRNRLRDIVKELAYYDDNGYKNLRYLYNYLETLGKSDKLNGRVILHYNFRHFTLVNQEIGSAAADVAMRSHHNGLEELIGENGGIYRLGGDNFVAVCEKDKLDSVISYLSETSAVYNKETGDCVKIASSVGVYCIPEDYDNPNHSEVIMGAIIASRIAQNGGREHVIFYDEKILSLKKKTMQVQNQFPDALRREEFHVFYQPKVNVLTGELSGAEALCRWIRNGKTVSPMDFIPALEQTSDICKLDFYMLDHVCADIRRWLDEGKKLVRISVNLSRKHIVNANLLEDVIKIIDKNNVPHEYIEIELTETTTDVEFIDLKHLVGGFREAGISSSVDDFGIGYSSLNLIRVIPWDILKVDKSFLPTEEDDPSSIRSIMFKYVVSMARELGLECIAEGVETQAQLDVLRENNCNIAQGYFFDKPLPVEEFEKRLDTGCYNIKR
ncbi:MAG: GGDEF domain-containing protein [Firmicutes bacterium]|nr:GGDEF domain-containing protein [Bacillota bacterium]